MRQFLKTLSLVALLITCATGATAQDAMRVLTKSEAQAFKYTWHDSDGNEKTNDITEEATDPAQIIALLKEIYTNKDIPGIWQAAYTENDVREREVFYGGIYGYDYVRNPIYNQYSQISEPIEYRQTVNTCDTSYLANKFSLGWEIEGSFYNYHRDGKFKWDYYLNYSQYDYYHYYLYDSKNWEFSGTPITSQKYKPNVEGYTMLLVKVKNSFNALDYIKFYEDKYGETINTKYKNHKDDDGNPQPQIPSVCLTTPEKLYDFINASLESVKLLDDGVYTPASEVEKYKNGVLYCINAEDVNRFFIISKGQARLNGTTSALAPFGQMFEQFSPAVTSALAGTGDFYSKLIVNHESYKVQHDCNSVMVNVHDFMMSGDADGGSYDLKNLMFFVPDYRLKYWYNDEKGYDGRQTSTSQNYASVTRYANYNQDYAPTLVMYNVELEADAEMKGVTSDHTYQVTLDWTSNITDYAPTLDQRYDIYLVVDGHITDGKVNSEPLDINQTTFTYTVPQYKAGYSLSYVVQASPVEKQDDGTYKERFSWQNSNVATVVIPGYDKQELLQLAIANDYYSHYDAASEQNLYWNKIPMNNGVGTSVVHNYISDGTDNKTRSVFKFYRIVDSEETLIAEMTVTKKDEGKRTIDYTIEMKEQTVVDASQYPAMSGTFTYDQHGVVDFGDFYICDQFAASTALNNHPGKYSYKVYFDAAKEFEVELYDDAGNSLGSQTVKQVYSNVSEVPVYKTESKIEGHNGYTIAEIDGDDESDGDKDHHLAVTSHEVTLQTRVEKSSQDRILHQLNWVKADRNKP